MAGLMAIQPEALVELLEPQAADARGHRRMQAFEQRTGQGRPLECLQEAGAHGIGTGMVTDAA